MRKIFIGLIIFLFAFSASAQNLWLGAEGQKFYDELLLRKSLKGEYGKYEGSPFLNEEFGEATVISSENEVFEKVPLRYNVYSDLFEVELEEGVYNLKRGGMAARVKLDDRDFVFTFYDYQSTEREGYLEVLIEGYYSLYKKYQIVFQEAEEAKPYQEAKPAAFQERAPLFYISSGENKPVFVKTKKNLLDIAGDKEQELKAFIKDSKLKIRDEADMVKAVEFLNSIK